MVQWCSIHPTYQNDGQIYGTKCVNMLKSPRFKWRKKSLIGFQADFGNWSRASETINGEETVLGTGGFFAFGIDGMFKGVVTILFMFIAFDVMIMSRWMKLFWLPHRQNGIAQTSTIEHFNRTITTAVLSINTAIFICLLGMTLVLTTVQPVYALVSLESAFFPPLSLCTISMGKFPWNILMLAFL